MVVQLEASGFPQYIHESMTKITTSFKSTVPSHSRPPGEYHPLIHPNFLAVRAQLWFVSWRGMRCRAPLGDMNMVSTTRRPLGRIRGIGCYLAGILLAKMSMNGRCNIAVIRRDTHIMVSKIVGKTFWPIFSTTSGQLGALHTWTHSR